MPQNEYMERHEKRFGKRLDYEERKRKRLAREGQHGASFKAQNLRGLRAKQYAESRRKEKIQMKKQIRAKGRPQLSPNEVVPSLLTILQRKRTSKTPVPPSHHPSLYHSTCSIGRMRTRRKLSAALSRTSGMRRALSSACLCQRSEV